MESVFHPVIFLCGLAVLYVGAETLLKGAVRLARSFGVSPLVIGLTLVAFGTSAPEFSLDLTAAFQGKGDLAFGDLVGSNVANIGLILGVGALVRPLGVHMRLLRVEAPIVIALSLGLWALAADGRVGRLDGAILLACFVAFLVSTYRLARREPPQVQEELKRQVAHSATRMASAPARGRRISGSGAWGTTDGVCGRADGEGVRGQRTGDRVDRRGRGHVATGVGDRGGRRLSWRG